MSPVDFFSVFLLLLIFPSSQSTTGPHIADVNLLLPPRMTHPVEYVLQGSDGCFSWSWDHHDFLSVEPEYNASSRCSTSARLRSIAPYGGRKETAVYASDRNTGTVIRCKVFIDNIHRIQIFHNSVKLDLDGLATLRVRAFDTEENVFSSLVGLRFTWQLMPKDNRGVHHLVHVPLKDSPLSDCGGFCGDLDIQAKLEDSGVFSDLYVVKGVEIGHEIVAVNLMEPQFEHITDKIVLTVAEAISIDPPSPLYVIIGSVVHYSLRVIRQNTPQALVLPSPHHWWSVVNSSVAQVDSHMGVAHALNLGTTTVTVEDTRVVGHVQLSSLHVVTPDAMYLYKLPLTPYGEPVEGVTATPSTTRWYLIAGRQYVIHLKVFSVGPGASEIFITESNDVKLQYNESAYWVTDVVPDSKFVRHGWKNSRILKATSQGLGRLLASLVYHSGHQETTKVLKVMQETMVCDQVKFDMGKINRSSQTIHLPWVPGLHQEMELRAAGGCAETITDYKWDTSDVTTVSVSASGVVQAKKPGQAIIKVASNYDLMNSAEVVVKVSVPSSMVMLHKFAVETVVGTNLQAAVTLKASDGNYFHRCDSFNSIVRWSCRSESFKLINSTSEASPFNKLLDIDGSKSLYTPPCAWTYIYALSADRAQLHATLSKELQSSNVPSYGPKLLEASSLIAAYHPLIVQQAGDGNQFGGYWIDLSRDKDYTDLRNLNEVYLVPGTKLDVILVGGPEKWEKDVEFVQKVIISEEEHSKLSDGVLVDEASVNMGGLYRLSCVAQGNFQLTFSRGNSVGDDHPLPAIENVKLSLICSFPSSITLLANERVNTLDLIQSATEADRNSERIRVAPITVANGCTIRVAAVGIHKSGKAFANSSSLNLKWGLSGCNELAYWNSNGLEKSGSSWEIFLVLLNASGQCTVRASVTGFSDTVASHLYEKVSPAIMISKNVLTDAIRLQLVSSLKLVPEHLLIFFNHNAKINMSIAGGTCFLDAAVNDTQVVEVVQPPTSLHCLHLTLSPRGLGTAVVTLNDTGLSPPIAASAVVQVADVDWIKIVSPEQISLMDGSVHLLDISVGVRDGSVFDPSQYAYMDIHIHIEDPILELVHEHVTRPGAGDIYVPNFLVRAVSVGVTTLYVSCKQQFGHEISSQLIKVEVYAPPKIHPADIFLVPGASYMITLKGGPTVGVFVEYASMDDGTVKIDRSSGRLSAVSPGNTTVRAIVYGKGDSVICEAQGSIRVGIPSSIVLSMQSEQLSIGREMPVFPNLAEGNLFSFYELCKNYEWNIEDEQVVSFQSSRGSHGDKHEFLLGVVKETKLRSRSDDTTLGFINVVHGRSAGRTTVAVSFSCKFISSGTILSRSYNASASLWVVSDPPLALGMPITWIFPPFYTTSNLLPASSKSYSQRDSYSRKGTIIYSLLRTCVGKNEEIQHDSISIEGQRIKTMEGNYLGCILAKDRTTGRTEIASCVKVVEVAQIRWDSKGSSFHVVDMAVGSEIVLATKYYDSLGNPFHEAYDVVRFNVETNYPDVVLINETFQGNGNIHIKAIRHGRAVVRISINNNPWKSDYMMISVGAHLYPHDPVLDVGHHLNFSIKGLNDPVSGRWLSANGSVLSINVLSGEAHAIEEGATQVIYEGVRSKLQTTVTVRKVDPIVVDPPAETLTNVPSQANGYQFSVRFSDTHSHKFETIKNIKGIQFDCWVDPSFVGYANPWRDLDTGNSYCLFFPYPPEHLVHSIPKSKAMRPDMYVSISASLRESEHTVGSASALFIAGFSLLVMDKVLTQLNLTPEYNKSIITVVGNIDVDVHWLRRDMMLVRPIRRNDFGIVGRAEYEVTVLSDEGFKDKITITLPATGQRVELGVHYETTPSLFWRFFAFLLAFLLIASIMVIIPCCMSNLREGPQQSIRPMQSVAGPVTPDRSSSSHYSAEQSPRTPQPFIEYVRRTIDETPYYKRDARRRFNPQNTY